MERRSDLSTLLNPGQTKSLIMTLSILEETLVEIEFAILHRPGRWITYEISDDELPDEIKTDIVARIAVIRERISRIMQEFNLPKRNKRTGAEIVGKLAFAWEILEGAKAKHLRGYGAIAEGLAEELDPRLDAVIVLVDDVRRIVSDSRRGRERDGNG